MSTTLAGPLVPGTPAGRRLCAIVDDLSGYLSERARDNDLAGRFARDSVRRLVDAGVLAACVPEADGGFGLVSLRDLAVLAGRLAAADASVATAVYMHLALSWYYARCVRCAADPDGYQVQRDWLRAIGRREMVACSSVAEPGTTSFQVTTTAVAATDGWLINGRKVLASISPMATHFYSRVRVRTEDGPMQGSVMIPLDIPGVTVKDNWQGLGLRGSGSGEVLFSDVLVPHAAISLRGRWGERTETSYEGRAAATLPLFGISLGIAEAAREQALASLVDADGVPRQQRTASVGARALLADLELTLAGARAALHTALLDLEEQVTHAAPRTVPAAVGRDLMRGAVTAGLIVERAAVRAVDLAMQVCGGRSYTAGHPLGRMCHDVRAAMFMRPHAPAEEWPDFLAQLALDDATARATGGLTAAR